MNGISSLNDVVQQVALCERHHTARLGSRTIVQIPADVPCAPLFVDFIVGKQRIKVNVGVVALHVGSNLKEVVH